LDCSALISMSAVEAFSAFGEDYINARDVGAHNRTPTRDSHYL
jgi:hypothetical protein